MKATTSQINTLKLFLRKNGLVQSSYEEKFHLNTRLGYCDIFTKLTGIAKNVLFSEGCWGIYGHNPKNDLLKTPMT